MIAGRTGRIWGVALVAALLAVGGCASSGGSSGGGSGSGGSVLTGDQIRATMEPDLLMAVQRLRPRWIRPRSVSTTAGASGDQVTLFVDGVPRGTVSNLDTVPIEAVAEVEYFSPSQAGFKFGTLAGNAGALEVRTRR